MIDKIKVEIANRKKSVFRDEYFELEDVTASVAMPIVNVDTLDDTLDVTNLTIYNTKEDPYLPFTRFIITLYEGENESRVYRYLDTDNVERKTFGKKGIYSHTIVLDEITKILEKETVGNLSFTNYLYSDSSNIMYDYDMDVAVGTGCYGIFSYTGASYANSNRFSRYALVGSTITNNVEMSIWCSTMKVWWMIPVNTIFYTVPLTKTTITSPDGTVSNFASGASFDLSTTGEYKITQTYYIDSGYGTLGVVPYSYYGAYWKRATIRVTFKIKVVESFDNINRTYTITSVINRLLKCHESLQEGGQDQKYVLDSRLYDKLNLIESPEFNFTNSTLFEALSQIGGHIHAIPRLIPMYEMQKNKLSVVNKNYSVSGSNLTLSYDTIEDEFTLTLTDSESSGYAVCQQTLELTGNAQYKVYCSIKNSSGESVSGISLVLSEDDTFSSVQTVALTSEKWVTFYAPSTASFLFRFVNNSGENVTVSDLKVEETGYYYAYTTVELPTSGSSGVISGGIIYKNTDTVSSDSSSTSTALTYKYESYNDPDYYSNWNVISFDFLSEGASYVDDVYSTNSTSMNADNYTKSLVSEIQNGLQSVYTADSAITEPFPDGYLSPRTESGNLIINNENFCLETTLPIGVVTSLIVNYNGTDYDLTQFVVEEAIYKTFKASESGSMAQSRFGYLYFKRGECNIKGCDVQAEYSNFLSDFFSTYPNSLSLAIMKAAGEESKAFDLNPVTNYSYRIEYVPYLNFMAKQVRYYVPEEMPNLNSYYNQNANVVDIEAVGENVRGVLARTSNNDYTETQYFKTYSSLPQIGQVSNDKYYCFSVATELITNTPIKATVSWSKNYNKLSEYISYKKAIREYEVSENESFERYINYDEYLIISDKFDLSEYYSCEIASFCNFVKNEDYAETDDESSEDIFETINEELSRNVIGASNLITNIWHETDDEVTIMSVSDDDDSDSTTSLTYPITYAYVQTFEEGNSTALSTFILPVSTFVYGNSVVFLTKMQDNYSAGSTTTTYSSYRLEDYIEYGNDYGRFDLMEIALGAENPYSSSVDLVGKSKVLYEFDEEVNEDDLKFDFRSSPFVVDKDSREAISFVAQLHVCTDSENVILGKNATSLIPCANEGTVKPRFAFFHVKPRLFADEISEDDFEETSIVYKTSSDLKTIAVYSIKNRNGNIACPVDCVGYGLVTSKNKLICFIDKPLSAGDEITPIYLMFRRKI